MKLVLQRDPFQKLGTTGKLYVNGAYFCFTLERPAAQFKSAYSCITAGTYPVVIAFSPHFNQDMPLLQNVPGRTGIEVHWGNFEFNYEGCIGVGDGRGPDAYGAPEIFNTKATFEQLFPEIEAGQAEGCTLEVRDAQIVSDIEIGM